MDNTRQSLKILWQAMSRDRQCYLRLERLLQQQRQLLITRQATALETVNQQLINSYQLLANSAARRRQLLIELGLSADQQGLQRLLARLPIVQQQRFRQGWQDLKQQAAQCQSINQANGWLLTMQHEILQKVFFQQSENDLYQPK